MRAFGRLTVAWKLVVVTGLAAGLMLILAALAVSPSIGGVSVQGQSDAGAFAGALLSWGAATILGALVILLAASAAMARRSLTKLTGAIRDLGAGRYDQPAPEMRGDDEIAAVAKALDGFRHDLADDRRERARLEAERLVVEEEHRRRAVEAATLAKTQAQAVAVLGEGAERLAEGDLIWRMREDGFTSELREIPRDFNAAVENLQATMVGILSAARSLHGGSAEIGEAADELSRRTERQAAGLGRTAVALDQIASTVKHDALGAERVQAVTQSARTNAEKSGRVVREAIEAMGGIETSSRQITSIIGVIDEIAFQTNLLALNAGVEAARAGEAGRGFAVVAQEVRALAQRSADAAKQIKALISTSTGQVDRGVKLVGQTGETLDQILLQVVEINDLVCDIASSTKAQAASVDEVTVTVRKIERSVQQNAAVVERSAGAGEALSAEAVELERLAGRYQATAQVHEYRPRAAPASPQREAFRDRYVQGANALKIEPRSRPGDR